MRSSIPATAIAALALLSSGPADAASILPGQYKATGTTHVEAQADVPALSALPAELRTYKRDFNPSFEIGVANGASGGELVVTVSTSGYTCKLIGKPSSDSTLSFAAGQHCQQSIRSDDFSAKLDATLTSGRAQLNARGQFELTTVWDVRGEVTVRVEKKILWSTVRIPVTVPVKGTLRSDAAGSKL